MPSTAYESWIRPLPSDPLEPKHPGGHCRQSALAIFRLILPFVLPWVLVISGASFSGYTCAASLPLTTQAAFWLDPSGTANLETAQEASFEFRDHPHFGRLPGAVWVRFDVDNPGPPIDQLLRVGPALLEHVDLWGWAQGHSFHADGGLVVPMSQRAIKDRETLFPVTLPSGHSVFYLRIAGPSNLALLIELWPRTEWQWRARVADLGNAFIFGALLMIVVITVSYAAWTQEWFWLSYAMAICSNCLFEACDDGFAALWLWPERPWTSLTVLPATLALDLSLYVIFFLRFVPLTNLHWVWRLLWGVPLAAVLVLSLVYGIDYRLGMPLLNGLVVMTAFTLTLLTLAAWRRGFKAARWAPLGFGIVLAAIFHRLGVGREWWADFRYADLWLLPLSGMIGTGLLLMAQMERLREFRAAELRYLKTIATAREEADAASRSKSLLLARVSHDLRAPLHTMLGYLDLVRHDRSGSKLSRYLDDVHTGGRSMLALVEELLQYACGEEGRLELHAKPTYLFSLLQEICRQGEALASQQNNRFVAHLDPPVSVAVVDGERLRSILMNLLSNACRMSVDGTIRFSATGHVEGPDVRLSFAIEDSGPGIAPEERERIFLPFEHGKSKPGAVGLGLAIVRQLTDLMSGTLQVESNPGRGATFTLSFLTRWADESEALLPVTHDVPLGYEGPPRTILIVDRLESNLGYLQDLLTSMGFDVVTATTADEALRCATYDPPDAAFVEQHLVLGDGWQVLDGLKNLNPKLPVILLSTRPAQPPPSRSSAWDFDAKVLKPAHGEALAAVLEQRLHLTWLHDTHPDGQQTSNPLQPSEAIYTADLMALRQAAHAGSLFEVEEWIERWRQHPGEHEFLKQLMPLVKGAKWMAVIQLVDSRLKTASTQQPDLE